ncbi:uncharacterized protein [Cardiocondyla obscurior]|uniref:uncharacterized protein n=1 Tax=Cardiocondyla obscurior TaxID=286306 RepID=UPI0039656B4D
MIAAKYRDRGRIAGVTSRNISCERRAKSRLDRKKPVSAGTSSQKTRSSKDEDAVKSCAAKSRGLRERRLLSRREDKIVHDDVEHKARLSDEASVASAGNNDPIYILRKEIHDWRVSGRLMDESERNSRLSEDETKRSFIRENRYEPIAEAVPDPGVLHELPSSTTTDHLTRRT